jgi:hypothetical protein
MKGIAPNPPPIVAEAEYDQDQLVQAIFNAALRDNFAVGRYALQWCERYSRGRTDAALAQLVNDINPDGEVTGDFVRECRVVAKEFPARVINLSWTHHRVALELDRSNAREWLDKAAKEEWSVRQLEQAIRRKVCPGKVRSPNLQRSISLEYAHFRRHVEELSDTAKISAWIKTSPDFLIHNKDFLKTKMVHVQKSAQVILDALAGVRRDRSAGKEA